MKVFIVVVGFYGEDLAPTSDIFGVFSTKEKANKFVEENKHKWQFQHEIQEWEIDRKKEREVRIS